MYVNMDFPDRISGYEDFQSKDRSEQFDLVINSIHKQHPDRIEVPVSYSDEDLLDIYNKNNKKDKLTLKKFKEYYDTFTLTDILKVLSPSIKHEYWVDTSEASYEEIASLYGEMWRNMLNTVGIRSVKKIELSVDEDDDESGIKVSFDNNSEKYCFSYALPDYELDYAIFNDFDAFCEKENIDSVFLVDEFIGEEMVGGYILPRNSALEFAKYLPVEY